MSLINDALKEARKTPPRPPGTFSPLRPAVDEPTPVRQWLGPGIILALIILAVFLTGWVTAYRGVNDATIEANQQVEEPSMPEPVVEVKPEPEPIPVKTEARPVLQGIFYSTTAPSAIVDGKTVRPGDQFNQYRVKEITKYAVIFVGPDGRNIKIGMGN